MGAISLMGLSACAQVSPDVARDGTDPVYRGVQTQILGEGLVNVIVSVDDDSTPEAARDYARCAAAQYGIFRGFSFLRHIRTTTDTVDGTLQADTIYTLSPSLPAGSKTIDAEVTVADCVASGIPTV